MGVMNQPAALVRWSLRDLAGRVAIEGEHFGLVHEVVGADEILDEIRRCAAQNGQLLGLQTHNEPGEAVGCQANIRLPNTVVRPP